MDNLGIIDLVTWILVPAIVGFLVGFLITKIVP